MLKENADIFGDYICGFLNESIKNTFPFILKDANITPIFEKECKGSKENYRPVSILPVRVRKGFSVQHCLLVMLEKCKNAVDKGKAFDALLTDLSKAFNRLPHELIIAKLNGYGFSLPALKLMHSYLS